MLLQREALTESQGWLLIVGRVRAWLAVSRVLVGAQPAGQVVAACALP
jgi:hypothetical protein